MALPRTDWQQSLFSPPDTAKMKLASRKILDAADGQWRSKEACAALAGCSPHAFSARLSELVRAGKVTKEHRKPNPGSGEVCGAWYYRLVRVVGEGEAP